MQESEIAELQEIFNLVDKDGGGSISREELREVMETLGIKATQEEVDKMIEEIDQDSNGEVECEEFVAVMSRNVNSAYTHEALIQAFEHFDELLNGNGFLTAAQIHTILSEHASSRVSEELITETLAKLKFDEDGRFDYRKYLNRVLI